MVADQVFSCDAIISPRMDSCCLELLVSHSELPLETNVQMKEEKRGKLSGAREKTFKVFEGVPSIKRCDQSIGIARRRPCSGVTKSYLEIGMEELIYRGLSPVSYTWSVLTPGASFSEEWSGGFDL